MSAELVERLEALVALASTVSDGDYLTRLNNGRLIALECAEFVQEHGPAIAAALREREAELSSLRDAPIAIMDTRDVLGICALAEEDFAALYALRGRRVRLIPENGNG